MKGLFAPLPFPSFSFRPWRLTAFLSLTLDLFDDGDEFRFPHARSPYDSVGTILGRDGDFVGVLPLSPLPPFDHAVCLKLMESCSTFFMPSL